MSALTITLEGVPDELLALTATSEGMARARAAVLAAFPELKVRTSAELDTRTEQEKALDSSRAQEKAAWQAREEKLVEQARGFRSEVKTA